jgi:hypothetical protein
MDEIALTGKQVSMMRHALGNDISHESYRNYYNTIEVNEDWEYLKRLGLASKNDMGSERGGIFYYVTPNGIEVLKQYVIY